MSPSSKRASFHHRVTCFAAATWLVVGAVGCRGCDHGYNLPAYGIPDRDAARADAADDGGAKAEHDGDPLDATETGASPGDDGSAVQNWAPSLNPDPSIWTPVPGSAPCGIFVADVSKVSMRPRSWSACGPGCLVADASRGISEPYAGAYSASYDQGVVTLRSEEGSPQGLTEIVERFPDGAPIAALLAHCYGLGVGAGAPWILPYSPPDGGMLVGHLAANGSIDWPGGLLPEPGITYHLFAFDPGWGGTFDDGSVVLFEWTTKALRVLDHGGESFISHARGAWLVWTVWDTTPAGNPILKGYSQSTGVQTLLQDGNIAVATVTDDRIIWATETGPAVRDGTYETATLAWGAIPSGGSSLQAQGHAAIPAVHGLVDVLAGGDYAATLGFVGSEPADTRLFIVRLSDAKVWAIKDPPQNRFADVVSVSPDEILLTAVDAGRSNSQTIQRLVRLQVTALDDLASAW